MCILFFLIVAIAVLIFPYNCLNGKKLLGLFFINVKPDYCLSYGELGDFIGGVFGGIVGTIIAGIACVYVYKTYISQKEELEKTIETAKTQQFESTFFNLIHIHKECLETIEILHYIPDDYNSQIEEDDQQNEKIFLKCKSRELHLEEIEQIERLMEHLQGAEAMFEDFNSNTNRNILLPKYYHSPWFNSIYMILKYLKDHNKNDKSFYTQYFYSQITRPEWWFLYAIFQAKEKLDSDIEHYNDYVALATDMRLFEYGYYYLVEKNSNIKRENIYEKNEF